MTKCCTIPTRVLTLDVPYGFYVLVTTVSPAKTDEATEMLFGGGGEFTESFRTAVSTRPIVYGMVWYGKCRFI